MKSKFLFFATCLIFSFNIAFAEPPVEVQGRISIYVFLHENCIISQFYTLPLKELHTTFASEQIQFIGLFPNHSSQPKSIQQFKEKYQIPFELKTDHTRQITNSLNATVTPEVVIYNESQNQILYQGRIDNSYARVGKKRQITTSSELKDALEAIVSDTPILTPKTQAVGCFINKVN